MNNSTKVQEVAFGVFALMVLALLREMNDYESMVLQATRP